MAMAEAGEAKVIPFPEIIKHPSEDYREQLEEPSRLNRLAKWGGSIALTGGLGAGAAFASLFVLPTDYEFTPHAAEVSLTLDSAARLDMEPIGSLAKPVDSFMGMGINVELGENASGGNLNENGFTEEDAQEYAAMMSSLEDDVAGLQSSLLTSWLQRSLAGTALAAGFLYGSHRLLGPNRREELSNSAKESMKAMLRSKAVRTTTALTLLAAASCDGYYSKDDYGTPVSHAFDGTALEGAYVSGKPLKTIINDYGPDVVDYFKRNEEFYGKVEKNLRAAFAQGYPLQPTENTDIILFYTDLHCNVGMAETIGIGADLLNAKWAITAGDETMGGTAWEEYCVKVIGRSLSGTLRAGVSGNHDSSVTEDHMVEQRYLMLDGNVSTLKGMQLLGDDDPRRSVFGQAIRQEREETNSTMSQRLADMACKNGVIDMLVVHDDEAASNTALRGCAKIILSGHNHNEEIRLITTADGELGLHLIGESAGGAEHGRPTIGTVQATAKFYAIERDKKSGKALHYQSVSVFPDGKVELSRPILLPRENELGDSEN